MNKRLLLLIPAFALLSVLLIGGIYRANASTDGDFNVTGGVLHTYNGTSPKVLVPSTVSTVGREAFMGNPYVEEVTFSDSVTRIDESAFKDCKALKRVVIPDSVATLGDSAFWGCSLLKDVKIGAGLKNFGAGAFSDCDSLKTIGISAENPYLSSYGSIVLSKNGNKLYQYAAGSENQAYGIPENVSDIERYAFWGCDNLKSLTVNGIKKIPDHAFSNCESLENVSMQIPTNEIGIRAFSGCTRLAQVFIPESVGKIHETAFDGCPDNMYVICSPYSYAYRYADEHFYQVSDRPMININYVYTEEMPYTENTQNTTASAEDTDDQAPSADGAGNILLPQQSLDVHDGLRVTAEGVILGNSPVVSDRAYVQIKAGEYTVFDGSKVPEVHVAEYLDDHLYYLDQTLTEYEFEEGLLQIGAFAFARTHLTDIKLPESLQVIDEGAFYHCDMLSNVYIPKSVEKIGKYAFNFTPWYNNWMDNAKDGDLLVVGDGVLIGIKGEKPETLPDYVKSVADGVLE